MKLNLPSKTPHAAALPSEPAALLKSSFYRSAEEAAQRKQAILAQVEHRRMLAKAALHAGRLARQSSHL